MKLTIADTKNAETQRKKINALLTLYAPSYGLMLPDAETTEETPDGALFYIASQGYQLRSGVWVAL